MRIVLGIDAAWTARNPSGFAVAAEADGGWKLIAAAPSYSTFHGLAWGVHAAYSSSLPDGKTILETCRKLAGAPVSLVAIDMPLAYSPITKRRASDDAVSRAYGARHCSTHSPSEERPGGISDRLRNEFSETSYPLLTRAIAIPGLIEVYPHPALVELAGSDRRLAYKVGNIRKYWPNQTTAARRKLLFSEWQKILDLLEAELPGTAATLQLPEITDATYVLKAFEDALDAVVCAWIGTLALSQRATPFGDEDSAIWIPTPITA